MTNIISLLYKILFGDIDYGKIIVSSSVPEVNIKTGWTPSKVLISFDNNHCTFVCGSHQDWFDVKITHHGFVIKCNVKSNFRSISWMAIK